MKIAVVLTCVLVAVLGGFGNYLRYTSHAPDSAPQWEAIPFELSGYFGDERRFDDASYEVLKADTSTLRLYNGPGGQRFWLFVAYFSSQEYGSQIHSPKHCLPGGGWKLDKVEPFQMALPDGAFINMYRLTILKGEMKELMFYWFETRSGSITNEFQLKWDLMKNSILLRPTDAAFVRLTVPVLDGDINSATKAAINFFATFRQSIQNALPFHN
ncbi:MAG: exosortase C-terminal domain/associated protein EpsI [Candidatus Zixiibacteriota bacterium]